MDFKNMTDEDLAALSAGLMAEMQKRSVVKDLQDRVVTAIMDAKAAGYNKGQVIAAVTKMINAAYVGEQA